MHLISIKQLKKHFNSVYIKSFKEEIMENKLLIDKILNDFEDAALKLNKVCANNLLMSMESENFTKNSCKNLEESNKTQAKLEFLKLEREKALQNLDILKIKQIDEKIKNLTID